MLTRIFFLFFVFSTVDVFLFFSLLFLLFPSTLFGWLFLRHLRCHLFVYFHLSVTFHVPALNHTFFFDKFIARLMSICARLWREVLAGALWNDGRERYCAIQSNAILCCVQANDMACFFLDNSISFTHTNWNRFYWHHFHDLFSFFLVVCVWVFSLPVHSYFIHSPLYCTSKYWFLILSHLSQFDFLSELNWTELDWLADAKYFPRSNRVACKSGYMQKKERKVVEIFFPMFIDLNFKDFPPYK